MKDLVWGDDAACDWQLQRDGLAVAGIGGIVTQGAHGGRVGCDDEAVLAAVDQSGLIGGGKRDVCLSRQEGNVSEKRRVRLLKPI